jgi:DNA repair protein RecO
MPYHIYHSDVIIIGGRNRGESDREIISYSREHGLIHVYAKSVREGKSKLRYALEGFRIAQMDYLRGKNGWKVTSALPKITFPNIYSQQMKRVLVAQQFRLLRRMVHGEERHQELYKHLMEMLYSIESAGDHELRPAELLFTIRLLAHLGYWGDSHADLLHNPIESTLFSRVETDRRELIALINSALRMTHL